MAINKRKVLDSARKLAQKGAKAKALKEYDKLLKADPRDARLRLEVAELHRRWGQVEEAVDAYRKVADQYMKDGFDAKAVAVYRQLLTLDPDRYESYVPLADVYQRMGLDSDASKALQTAADGFHKQGKKREALELLRKMATLDPTNTTSRLKVADLLRQEGLQDEAVAEYQAVATELDRQGETEATITCYQRILELRPDDLDVLDSVARALMKLGRADRAEPFAKKALELDSDDEKRYELLCEVYRATGNDVALTDVSKDLAKLFRNRGDEDRAREIMQRLPDQGAFGVDDDSDGAGGLDASTDELEIGGGEGSAFGQVGDEPLLSDDELLGDEAFLSGVGARPSLDLDEPVAEAPGDDAGAAASDPVPAEGDPEQLLAEASVYLRYGKTEQAIASLGGVIAQEPENRAAHEKLGEAWSESGAPERAVASWARAAELAGAAGDTAAVEILRDRIAALDPDAAAELGPADDGPVAAASAEHDAHEEVVFDDIEIEIDDDLDDVGAGVAADAASDADADVDLDVDIDVAMDDEPVAADTASELSADAEVEIDIDDSDFGMDAVSDDDEVTEPEPAADPEVGAGTSSTSSQQIQEEFEEAEFYREQGLEDEAEAIYRRILAVAPNHPSALLRLGELEAQRADAAQPAAVPAADDEDEEASVDVETAAPAGDDVLGDDIEIEIDDDLLGVDAASDGPESDTDEEETAPEAALSSPTLVDVDTDDTAADLAADPSEAEPASEPEPASAPQPVQAEATAPAVETPAPAPAPAHQHEEGSFDLAAELADVLSDVDQHAEEAASPASDEGFESIFADFKQGVSQTLSEGDDETRFDLGIAYREMGLFEDAIGEFALCSEVPERRTESLHMMALCALDLGRATDAVNHLQQAVSDDSLSPERLIGLRFDLGRAYEASGDRERARTAFEQVASADPGFPGVREHLHELDRAGVQPVAEPEDEAFESFDDVLAESAPATEATAIESATTELDVADLREELAAATPEPVEADTGGDLDENREPAEAGEGALADEPGDVSEPAEAEPESAPRKRRKRKISFV